MWRISLLKAAWIFLDKSQGFLRKDSHLKPCEKQREREREKKDWGKPAALESASTEFFTTVDQKSEWKSQKYLFCLEFQRKQICIKE